MAIPDTWDKTKERVRWTASSNVWERIETWRGLAGVAGATFGEWLANYIGYTSLSYDKKAIGEDGTGVMEVEIGFATNQEGDVLPPSDPNYGLIERVWEKRVIRQQRDLFKHPLADVLYAVDMNWVPRIRKAVQAYNQAMREWNKACEEYWNASDPNRTHDADDTTVPLPAGCPAEPALDWYITMAIPLVIQGNVITPRPVTLEQLDTHTWLFAEYLADQTATYPYDIPVMKKTDTVLSVANEALWASNVNKGRILSYSTLLSSEPSMALAALINSGQYTAWYWIKGEPNVSQTSNGYFRIEQDYTGIEAPTPLDIKRSGGPIL